MTNSRLYFSNLASIHKSATQRLKEIREVFPSLRAYIVYSSRWGQAEFGLPIEQSFMAFPKQFEMEELEYDRNIAIGYRAKYFLDPPREKEPNRRIGEEDKAKMKAEGKELISQIIETLCLVPLSNNLCVEMRFHDLDFDLIAELQKCPLVSRELTPQGRDSIKIVLGNISDFSKD